jgi:hypothetical protein
MEGLRVFQGDYQSWNSFFVKTAIQSHSYYPSGYLNVRLICTCSTNNKTDSLSGCLPTYKILFFNPIDQRHNYCLLSLKIYGC